MGASIPPEVILFVALIAIGYWGGLQLWHVLQMFWHQLPAIGHGLLHILTAGVK